MQIKFIVISDQQFSPTTKGSHYLWFSIGCNAQQSRSVTHHKLIRKRHRFWTNRTHSSEIFSWIWFTSQLNQSQIRSEKMPTSPDFQLEVECRQCRRTHIYNQRQISIRSCHCCGARDFIVKVIWINVVNCIWI